nr:hypothetical protein [Jiella sonneratiae]
MSDAIPHLKGVAKFDFRVGQHEIGKLSDDAMADLPDLLDRFGQCKLVEFLGLQTLKTGSFDDALAPQARAVQRDENIDQERVVFGRTHSARKSR